jgi:glucuronide carrier protein
MKLKPLQVLGYGAGDMANNLVFSTQSLFLLIYYTDVAGLTAAEAGTMFLVVRAWDAFSDILAGRMVDKTSTRWGKFRPFLMFGTIPLLAMSFLTFHVPDLSHSGKLAYAYVTYALLGLAYSFVNIPYGSLATVITQEPRERARLGAIRGIGASLAILILVIMIAPNTRNTEGLQHTFTVVTLLFIVLGFALYMFTFLTAKETVQRSVEHVTFKQTIASLRGNGPLLMLCVSTLLYLIGMSNGVGAFYARDVLGDASLFIPMTILTTAAFFITAPLAPRLVVRVGKKGGYFLGAGLTVTGYLGAFLVPARPVWVPIACWTIAGLGVALVNTMMWPFEADTVEYGEWKSGVRTEGATYAVFSFTRKLGQSIGGAIGAFALAGGGYVAKASSQSDGAVMSIRFGAALLPAITAALAFSIMYFYPLTERKFKQIVAETVARRGAATHQEIVSARVPTTV